MSLVAFPTVAVPKAEAMRAADADNQFRELMASESRRYMFSTNNILFVLDSEYSFERFGPERIVSAIRLRCVLSALTPSGYVNSTHTYQ